MNFKILFSTFNKKGYKKFSGEADDKDFEITFLNGKRPNSISIKCSDNLISVNFNIRKSIYQFDKREFNDITFDELIELIKAL